MNRRFVEKICLCVLGIVILSLIATTYRNYRVKEGKAPYLTVKEALPVVRAFSDIEELSVYEDRWKDREANGEDKVTVGEIREWLTFFPEVSAEVLKDYKKEDWYIGIADWHGILEELVQQYGNGEIVWNCLAFMGTHQEVTDEKGGTPDNSQILTNKGVFYSYYWNTEAYMYSAVEVLCTGDTILTVKGYTKEAKVISNVYLAGASSEEYHFFTNGYHIHYTVGTETGSDSFIEVSREPVTGELLDLSFDRGRITVLPKDAEYINGKLLQISEEGFEIEGHGLFEADEDMVVYRLYGELASLSKSDLRIGYDFADFVLENGKVAACLMMKDEDMEYIRVLLKSTDYTGRYHENFIAECNQDYTIIYYENGVEKEREEMQAKDKITIEAKEVADGQTRIKIQPKVLSATTRVESLKRSQGTPAYRGSMELTGTDEGILVVNEVLLEDYLRYVVPSEMPSSYPKEALMAQAISARTYAYGKMLQAGLPAQGAHVDDSAGFQVYNNIEEQDSTSEAVRATHNRIAEYRGEPIGMYYYSTSCGVGTDISIWHGSETGPEYLDARIIGGEKGTVTPEELSKEEAFRKWIEGRDSSHYEAKEGWYRWTYQVKEVKISHMEEVLRERYAKNKNLILTQNSQGDFESKEIRELGSLLNMEVTKRLPGGVADELILTGTKAVVKVISELNIRYVLADGETKVLRQSGDYVDASSSIPSAFMVLDVERKEGEVIGYTIAGGGFGHGVGMSQNGARNMALQGMNCEEILQFYYPGIEIETLSYEEEQ